MRSNSIWKVIINPTSGSGKAKRLWPKIKNLLEENKIEFDAEFTARHGHGKELVIEAAAKGYRQILAVGGDGTVHNVVNGILSQSVCHSVEITLGVIPIGTGNDWVKTHNISKNLKKAIQTIKDQSSDIQDVGLIEFSDSRADPVYFNNLAGFGFDAYVVERVGKLKKYGAMAYLLGALSGLFKFKPIKVFVETDVSKSEAKVLLAVTGIGKYAGGGMRLTDYSGYNNGSLDLGMANNFTTVDLIRNIFRLFNGKISRSKKIQQEKISYLKAEFPKGEYPWVQADGELIGKGNLKISIMRSALRVCK